MPVVAVAAEDVGNGRFGHKFRLLLVMVTLPVMVIDHIINDVAKGGMADVMEQRRNLLRQVSSQPGHQQHGSDGMVQAAGRRGQTNQAGNAVLHHAAQSPQRVRL